MSDWLTAVLAVGLFLGVLILLDVMSPFCFRCVVENDGIRVRLFGRIPLVHVPFDEITRIDVQSVYKSFVDGVLVSSLGIGVRLFHRPVVVWREGKDPVLISPSDPHAFIADVRQHPRFAGRLTSA